MKGRHAAALLCVLGMHVLLLLALLGLDVDVRDVDADIFTSEPITLDLAPLDPGPPPLASNAIASNAITLTPPELPPEPPSPQATPPAAAAPAAAAVPVAPPARVDWPIEGRKSAARVLAAEREAERIAKMFSGPDGTWASLTKRERSRVKKFRWKPNIDGLEYDDKGNAIYHISDGCVLVNMAYIGCKIGKAKVHGDLFNDMKLYFDEQRLPLTDEGNGTEPEALRPAN